MKKSRLQWASVSVAAALTVGVVVELPSELGVSAQTRLSIWDGAYTAEQAARGEALYQSWCGLCHGGALEGGETAPALVGNEFMWAWNGLSLGDLFERLRISMPEGNPGDMSRGQKADVLAFMLSKNGVPPGAQELASRTAPLKLIRFDAVSP